VVLAWVLGWALDRADAVEDVAVEGVGGVDAGVAAKLSG
jgi:hypothetical protein